MCDHSNRRAPEKADLSNIETFQRQQTIVKLSVTRIALPNKLLPAGAPSARRQRYMSHPWTI
jgi:hypothetical protein